MRKGFTLVELLIVVIVIAILATLALPQYIKAVARARIGKAKHHLALVAEAEKMYRADNDVYVAFTNAELANTNAGLGNYVELVEVSADEDWEYSGTAAVANPPTFTLTATREEGPYVGSTITLNQNGVIVDFPL